jgi:hypothetical protein
MPRLNVEPDGLGALAHYCSALAGDLLAAGAPQSAVPTFQATAEATQMLHASISAVNGVMHARLMGTSAALLNSAVGYLQNEVSSSDRLAAFVTTPGM